jgi:hypothetical protein
LSAKEKQTKQIPEERGRFIKLNRSNFVESISLKEAKRLISLWSSGTFPTVVESIRYHFARHGVEVSAKNVWEYLKKSESFSKNLRKSRKSKLENGCIRYMKKGFYVIKEIDGKILSFGTE